MADNVAKLKVNGYNVNCKYRGALHCGTKGTLQ